MGGRAAAAEQAAGIACLPVARTAADLQRERREHSEAQAQQMVWAWRRGRLQWEQVQVWAALAQPLLAVVVLVVEAAELEAGMVQVAQRPPPAGGRHETRRGSALPPARKRRRVPLTMLRWARLAGNKGEEEARL